MFRPRGLTTATSSGMLLHMKAALTACFILVSLVGDSEPNKQTPIFVDCRPDCVLLDSGNTKLTWEDLQRPANALEKLLDKVQAERETQYVVVIARPQSVKLYCSSLSCS
jgi:hypothetical protein